MESAAKMALLCRLINDKSILATVLNYLCKVWRLSHCWITL